MRHSPTTTTINFISSGSSLPDQRLGAEPDFVNNRISRLDAGSRIGSFTAEDQLHQGGPPTDFAELRLQKDTVPTR
jgi:hypothetical protein